MNKLTLVLALLVAACGPGPEGSSDGDCADNIDNDNDGKYDCDDDGCSGGPVCTELKRKAEEAAQAKAAARAAEEAAAKKAAEEEAKRPYIELEGLWAQKAHNGADIAHKAAVKYCEDLSLAGRDDWRLPTVNEALAMVKAKKLPPEPYVMWTSTMRDRKRASIVGITSGAVNDLGIPYDGDVRARCVRDHAN